MRYYIHFSKPDNIYLLPVGFSKELIFVNLVDHDYKKEYIGATPENAKILGRVPLVVKKKDNIKDKPIEAVNTTFYNGYLHNAITVKSTEIFRVLFNFTDANKNATENVLDLVIKYNFNYNAVKELETKLKEAKLDEDRQKYKLRIQNIYNSLYSGLKPSKQQLDSFIDSIEYYKETLYGKEKNS